MLGTGILNVEPYADTIVDEHGNEIFADTERRWHDWTETMDGHLELEAAGRTAPGFDNWSVFWNSTFRSLRKNQQNHERYVAYLLDRRSQKGLPELSVYE